jgi:hypothetical protein
MVGWALTTLGTGASLPPTVIGTCACVSPDAAELETMTQ